VALPRDIVAGLTRRLAERAGLELPAWVVEARATARMEVLGVSATEYVELVATPRGRVELDELVEAVRVGETRFFRHMSQVAALVDVVAPAIAARGRRSVRVWSAGCASGEEAYTLAIVLSRVLPEHSVTVVATDVSEDALAVAARGRYPRAALGHVPEEWRDAFEDVGADDDDREIRVRPEIAKRVTFEQANLVEGEAPRGCQVVWCRNVLIYFASEARKRAVQKLLSALDTGGWLFVGYSEQLRDVVELEAVRAGDVTIYVKRGTGASLPTRTPVVGIPIQAQPSARTTLPMPTIVKPEPESQSVRRVVARGDCGGLGREIATALGGAGLKQLEVDLDGAEVVPDEVAVTLRRAKAAAHAAGVVLVLHATRAGVKRWLRRVGLEGPP
jgi:chemotaxis protein methyltransferase CheR